jgi:hypothetical protein
VVLTERGSDEPRLREYLLGGLSPPERVGLEEEYFGDDALFEALAALEEEIIRDYLRGGLRREERARFEARLSACPDLRRKVGVSRGVWRTLAARPGGGRALGWRRAVPTWLFAVPPLWRVAALATVVCLCVGVAALAVGIFRLQGRVAGLEAAARQGSSVSPALSFILLPGVTRSPGASSNVLVVPSGSAEVALQLAARRDYGMTALSAVLRVVDREGQIWGGAALEDRGSVVVTIPGAVLRPNDYILELREQPKHGVGQQLESYVFSVRSGE